ncbi:MAG: glycosyltransferase family 4 protein, partial [Desulfobacula sp.]
GVMRWVSRASDRMISVLNTKCYADSPSQARFLVTEGVIPARKIAVVGNGSLAGVDMKRFNPDQWSFTAKQEIRKHLGLEVSSKVIIFVGRISRDKGIAELIAAFYKLLNMNYDIDLILVGPQDQDCGGINSLNLKEAEQCTRIHYIGYTEYPEIYLAISDIFCLPSYREGFGTVVIEAAAMGLPTVGTSIYGITDAIVDGETGILVPPKNDHKLMEALKRLIDHPDELKKMGKSAKERCDRLFNTNKFNEKFIEEYFNILKNKKMLD